MPKQKTSSSAKKRFKVTGTGKILRRHAMQSHNLEKKSAKRKRDFSRPESVAKADVKEARKLLDEKWTYWQGPRFASSLPIKWKIVDDPVDKGTVVMTDDPAAAAARAPAALSAVHLVELLLRQLLQRLLPPARLSLRVRIVPGVGHDNALMAPAAARAMFEPMK